MTDHMCNLDFKRSNPDIGLITRTRTHGPELDMVESAVPGLVDLFARQEHEIAVFWEPKIDVGFPDLVIALFSPESYALWPKARSMVTNKDLKIVHQLFNSRGMSSAGLEQRLGLSSRELLRSLERLLDARLVRRTSSKWRLIPFCEIFGIRRLIAVEAKLSNWAGAFAQAESNSWFASESYVLSPVSHPLVATMDRSSKHCVGILACGTGYPKQVVPAIRRRLPASYASWQFNEWIGREIMRKEEG